VFAGAAVLSSRSFDCGIDGKEREAAIPNSSERDGQPIDLAGKGLDFLAQSCERRRLFVSPLLIGATTSAERPAGSTAPKRGRPKKRRGPGRPPARGKARLEKSRAQRRFFFDIMFENNSFPLGLDGNCMLTACGVTTAVLNHFALGLICTFSRKGGKQNSASSPLVVRTDSEE